MWDTNLVVHLLHSLLTSRRSSSPLFDAGSGHCEGLSAFLIGWVLMASVGRVTIRDRDLVANGVHLLFVARQSGREKINAEVPRSIRGQVITTGLLFYLNRIAEIRNRNWGMYSR